MILLLFLFLLFLCWGSFLNVVGYRIIHGYSLVLPRSFCPSCHTTIKWYDLIPLLSWFILRSKCRTCKAKISPLYPLIEFLTALVLTALIIFIEPRYWVSYGIFFSALIVTIRTDAETMLIARSMTLALVPLAFLLSAFDFLPLSLFESILGALFGYSILWSIAKIFYIIKKQEGMGEGDFELLSMIGAFTGIVGAWITMLIGACLGTLAALIALMQGADRSTKIAFGPWLALGGVIYIFIQEWLQRFLL